MKIRRGSIVLRYGEGKCSFMSATRHSSREIDSHRNIPSSFQGFRIAASCTCVQWLLCCDTREHSGMPFMQRLRDCEFTVAKRYKDQGTIYGQTKSTPSRQKQVVEPSSGSLCQIRLFFSCVHQRRIPASSKPECFSPVQPPDDAVRIHEAVRDPRVLMMTVTCASPMMHEGNRRRPLKLPRCTRDTCSATR